jgi:hypothetical protein
MTRRRSCTKPSSRRIRRIPCAPPPPATLSRASAPHVARGALSSRAAPCIARRADRRAPSRAPGPLTAAGPRPHLRLFPPVSLKRSACPSESNALHMPARAQHVMKRQVALLTATGNTPAAVAALVEYLTLYSSDGDGWLELARLYLAEGQLRKAAFCYEELLLLAPANHVFHIKYAEVSCGRRAELSVGGRRSRPAHLLLVRTLLLLRCRGTEARAGAAAIGRPSTAERGWLLREFGPVCDSLRVCAHSPAPSPHTRMLAPLCSPLALLLSRSPPGSIPRRSCTRSAARRSRLRASTLRTRSTSARTRTRALSTAS